MDLSDAEKQLITLDPTLGAVIRRNGHLPMRPQRGYYEALARSIISQQISVKAAASISERFRQATNLQPGEMLLLTEDQTKMIGLSGQKVRYLQDLARHFIDNPAVFDHLEGLEDEAVIAELTRVKGVGMWTAQMFLMFTLRRPDVFAPGDRGLQLAIEQIYQLPANTPESQIVAIADTWRPHRTTASLHLWQSLNNTP